MEKQQSSLNPKIKNTKELARDAFNELKDYQAGKKKLIKTGREYIDCHIGGLKASDLFLLASQSGTGKTYELMKVINNILDTEINENSSEFVTLEFNLEMRMLDLVVRDIHKLTEKDKSKIITEEFTTEEKEIVNEYYKRLTDGRRFIVEESINTAEFTDICMKFCDENKDKEAIIITIDHLLLIQKSEYGENPLEKVVEVTNTLRKKYNNVYFIYLSQLNRTNYTNIKEKSNDMVPKTDSIFGSSAMEFLSSYVVILYSPFKLGVTEYMKVLEDRYPDLTDFMTEPNERGFVSFLTVGNLFVHVVKIRETDVPYNNLFIERMYLNNDTITKMKMDIEKDISKSNTKLGESLPMFNPFTEDIFEDEEI